MNETTAITATDPEPGPVGQGPTEVRPGHGRDHGADQPALPFDDGADEPIGYTLTARARRAIAPHAVPSLRVVDPRPSAPDDDADLDRPGDTRPSRARALRRGGASFRAIAQELGVDDLVVRAWVGDVGARHVRGRVPRVGSPLARPGDDAEPASADEQRLAFELARAAAREDAAARLADPMFAAGLGIVSAILTSDEHAAMLTTSRIDVAAAAVRWLATQASLDVATLRVVLRLGPDVPGDLARHRWATALGLATARVLHARWRGAPSGDAVEALIRLPDPVLAATLAGWRDALLTAHDHDVQDTGF